MSALLPTPGELAANVALFLLLAPIISGLCYISFLIGHFRGFVDGIYLEAGEWRRYLEQIILEGKFIP